VDFHLKAHTDVIVPTGTTGESATLSHEEHRRVMSIVIEHIARRVPVVCGAGSNNTDEALGLVRYAKKMRAEGVLVVTPYYNRPTQEGLYRHYAFLARKVDIPIILYNVPGRTGVSLTPATVARLSKIPNIVAIKEASGNLDQVDQILELCGITVISGEDSLTFPMMAIGAKGVISVTANVVPTLVREMVHATLQGSLEQGRELHRKLYPLSKALFLETNPIPVKTALGMMGLIRPEFRLPLCGMAAENKAKLKKVMEDLEVI
jgi:4-hydroxy-tetrahydrodipicolinate synthase